MSEVLEIIKNVQSNMYAKYGLKIDNFLPEEESSEYHAHTFTLKNKNGKEGKRAIRVYTPWDTTISAQAAKTQKWQGQFFVDLGGI